jgi:catechol 2,3-dioxygenase-like lactoylglutathione lyase family enzyme
MKLDAIGIVASDLAKSIAFYGLLGLKFAGPPGVDHLEAKTATGLRVMLDSEALIKQFAPEWTRHVGTGIALAFDCGTPAQVDATCETIRAAGHRIKAEPWDAFWGQRYACILDPDGNQIDLFAALPA